jgi:superfamily II DNA or RNA helicase
MSTKPDISHSSEASSAPPDPFLVDLEQLQALVSERIIRRGLAYFKEHRVTDIGVHPTHLTGVVEGSNADEPYFTEVSLDQDGELVVDCDCPFDWEPFCKHAVALLLAYGAQQPVTEHEVRDAADEAIEARIKRARAEVVVEHHQGHAWFGTFHASSLAAQRPRSSPYQVQIRALKERANHCNCPDFAINGLGTCKHIEAVLHRLRQRGPKKFEQLAKKGPPFCFVHVAWDVPDAPRLRLHRSRAVRPELAEVLHRHFDHEGYLHEDRLPESIHRLEQDLRPHTDAVIGDDVRDYVQRRVEEQAHQLQGQAIREEILRQGRQVAGVKARLYPYQVEGVAFLASNGRAVLADDMGLGKTLQAIAAATWLMREAFVRRVCIVCPASLKHQWAREIERFTDQPVAVVQGPARERAAFYEQAHPFTVINYELILRDATVINERLAPDLLIIDEAQRIKNWRTKSAAAIKSLQSRYAFVLTGTPLENRLEDLYSIMQVVDSRVLGPLWRFMLDFHVTDDRGRVLGYRNLSELRRRLAPIMLRRDRRLVRDQLPPRIQQQRDVPLTAAQVELHDTALSSAAKFAKIMQRRQLTPSEEKRFMACLQQARMACDAAGLVDKKTEGSPKLDELARLLEELCREGGRKAVVFSQWERMTAMAEDVARKLGLGVARLHGGVPTSARGKLLDQFRDDPTVQVFISTDAGGVGLNLQAASVLINLDMPWNPAVLEQRIARVHRLGQVEPVQVLLLLAEASYEQQVASLLGSKRALFDNVIVGEGDEEVLGLTKRSLELLAADLTEESKPEGSLPSEQTPAAEEPDLGDPSDEASATVQEETVRRQNPDETPSDDAPARGLALVQAQLGLQIERVVGTTGGLLVVVDTITDEARQVVDEANEIHPVALLDAWSAAQLNRLGPASPLGDSTVVYERSQPPTPSHSPFRTVAERKLEAAEVLLGQGCHAEGLDLLSQAVVAASAARQEADRIPETSQVPVWVFGELVPAGLLTSEEATAVTRTVSLAAAGEIPLPLLEQALVDARGLVARA